MRSVDTPSDSESSFSAERAIAAPFGTVLSDHMLVADCLDGRWEVPAILPYGALALPPAPSAVQYGQAIFEGFKAHALSDGGVALFRPRDNHARFNRSAARLLMPETPASLFIDGIVELVKRDCEGVPRSPGSALYIRPVLFGIDEALQVRPASRYRFVTLTSPVGPYFAGAINLLVEERDVRAARATSNRLAITRRVYARGRRVSRAATTA